MTQRDDQLDQALELEHRIAYGERQFIWFQMHAMRAHAEIVSGSYKLRNSSQGREPTEEEKTHGETIGRRPHTEDEKLQEAIRIMNRFVQFMAESNDSLDKNRRELSKLIRSNDR